MLVTKRNISSSKIETVFLMHHQQRNDTWTIFIPWESPSPAGLQTGFSPSFLSFFLMSHFTVVGGMTKRKPRWLPLWLSCGESARPCRRRGFDPWSRRIPHAEERLSPRATTVEHALYAWEFTCRACEPHYRIHASQLLKPIHPRARAPQQEKPPQWEARAPQLERGPCLLQLEKSLCSNRDLSQPKINK